MPACRALAEKEAAKVLGYSALADFFHLGAVQWAGGSVVKLLCGLYEFG
jgi:hypothetical protein